jgi:adenine-specific DNA methylase
MEQPEVEATEEETLTLSSEEMDALSEEQVKQTGGFLSRLKEAIESGMITSGQARQLRQQYGISQATFTRKQTTKSQRKARRKMQSASRKANRASGKKGQKQTGRV